MSNNSSSNVRESSPPAIGLPRAIELAPCAGEHASSVREPSTEGDESLGSVPVEGSVANARARLRSIGKLPNHRVVSELLRLNQELHRLDAELLLFLGELDQRQLHREYAVSSTFEFCVQRLGYSEDVAWKRVGAARMIRRFPRTFELLAEGRVHLTALMLIKPHLTEENHEQWLSWVCGKSKRQIEKLVASLIPQPDTRTSIRRMPVTHATVLAKPRSTSDTLATPATPLAPITLLGPMGSASVSSPGSTSVAPVTSLGSSGRAPGDAHGALHSSPAARVSPLSSSTYRVTFTACERLKQKLDRAHEMLSHSIDPRDLSALLERALDCLLDREAKRRFGARQSATVRLSKLAPCCGILDESATVRLSKLAPCCGILDESAPRLAMSTGQEQASCHRTAQAHRDAQDPDPARSNGAQSAPTASPHPKRRRRISASIRRAVFERDGGQCTFLDGQERRCQERRYLEFDHIEPHALGGSESASDLRLRCRAHNQLEAERWFGRTRVKQAARCANLRRRP